MPGTYLSGRTYFLISKSDMTEQVRQAFGQVASTENKTTQKVPIMTFNQNHVYLGLKIVIGFDEKTGKQKDPVPKITASFNGQFVEYPLDGEFWKAYAEFVSKFAEALEGVHIENSTIIDDVAYAKQMMAQFKNKGA